MQDELSAQAFDFDQGSNLTDLSLHDSNPKSATVLRGKRSGEIGLPNVICTCSMDLFQYLKKLRKRRPFEE